MSTSFVSDCPVEMGSESDATSSIEESDAFVSCVSPGPSAGYRVDSSDDEGEPTEDELRCCVCFGPKVPFVVLSPCGHSLCQRCSNRLQRCPLCRAVINSHRISTRRTIDLVRVTGRCSRCRSRVFDSELNEHQCATPVDLSDESDDDVQEGAPPFTGYFRVSLIPVEHFRQIFLAAAALGPVPGMWPSQT
jgi:hypothetical protein